MLILFAPGSAPDKSSHANHIANKKKSRENYFPVRLESARESKRSKNARSSKE